MGNGVAKPGGGKGFAAVPEGPRLGITSLNGEEVEQRLLEPGYFEPTLQWDTEQRVNDLHWS